MSVFNSTVLSSSPVIGGSDCLEDGVRYGNFNIFESHDSGDFTILDCIQNCTTLTDCVGVSMSPMNSTQRRCFFKSAMTTPLNGSNTQSMKLDCCKYGDVFLEHGVCDFLFFFFSFSPQDDAGGCLRQAKEFHSDSGGNPVNITQWTVGDIWECLEECKFFHSNCTGVTLMLKYMKCHHFTAPLGESNLHVTDGKVSVFADCKWFESFLMVIWILSTVF